MTRKVGQAAHKGLQEKRAHPQIPPCFRIEHVRDSLAGRVRI